MKPNFVGNLSHRFFFLTLASLLFLGFSDDTKAATPNWVRLPVNQVNDVVVDSLGVIYITKTDGSVHYSVNGTFYIPIPTPALTSGGTPLERTVTVYKATRIAIAPNNVLWAAFAKTVTTTTRNPSTVNSTTTHHLYYRPSPTREWIERLNAPEPADVTIAADGRIIVASAAPPYSVFYIYNYADENLPFVRSSNSEGSSRVSAGNGDVVWAVRRDGTLWKFANNNWTQTSYAGISDVGASHSGVVIALVEQKNMTHNGALWASTNAGDTFTKNLQTTDCQNVAASSTGHLYMVNLSGILFKTRLPLRPPPRRRRR